MKKLLIAALIALFALPALAANTITTGPGVINLVLDSDWTWVDTVPNRPEGLTVDYIIFHPGATSDVLVMRDIADTGPYIFPPCAAQNAEDSKILYGNGANLRIHIDFDTSTLSAGHVIIIKYH